jgi:malonate transporter MadL subunit
MNQNNADSGIPSDSLRSDTALAALLSVKANVGGVGIAMMLLIAAKLWLVQRGLLSRGLKLGVEFWRALYIPIVVAIAAQQNVVSAIKGGPIALIASVGALIACFAAVSLISRFSGRVETMDEIEAREASVQASSRAAIGQPA